jgi:hypothetical protein
MAMRKRHKMAIGDWVEVRSKEEILRTLDSKGQLDGMPFMPEMFSFFGKRFQVYKRAHKTCDPDYYSRRIESAVHLETRCDGQAHGGCQAGCLLFWKEAWLKPISPHMPHDSAPGIEPYSAGNGAASIGGCTELNIWDHVQVADPNGGGPAYICQTTQVLHAGKLLKWWDIRQYLVDYSSGNVGLRRFFSGFVYSMYFNLSQSGLGLGRAMRWFYDMARPLWRGSRWPRRKGFIPEGQPTPAAALNLQPGELVRVKSHEEILKTVNTASRNRGLWWDAELVPYCGGTFRVLDRVSKVIDEKTGKMLEMKNPNIILDSVVCQARYSACRMFCPKSTYAYWREIWLERVGPHVPGNGVVDVARQQLPVVSEINLPSMQG